MPRSSPPRPLPPRCGPHYGAHGSPDVSSGEALLRVTTYGSSSCRLFISGLDTTESGLVVHLSIGLVPGCTADARPYTYLIAVAEDQLPAVPFPIEVRGSDFGGTVTITDVPGLR